MKCKYEHDGDCCYACADQYMRKCKQPCEFLNPLTNAQKIRAMTDEELAEFLWDETDHTFNYCWVCEYYTHEAPPCYSLGEKNECIKARVKWLQQPVKGGADHE